MNRYALYMSRKPKRLAWKQSKLGEAFMNLWQPGALYASSRGYTILQGFDAKGNEPA